MKRNMKIEVFRETGDDKDWRWRIRSSNGKIVATSGEGYKRKTACVAMAEKVSHEIELVVVEV